LICLDFYMLAMKKLFLAMALLPIIHSKGQDFSLYQKSELISGNDTLRYRILYPLGYEEGKKYPLLVILHGSGERGRDNEKQLVHGGNLFVKKETREKFPAIVIFPQCPDDTTWSYYQWKDSPANKRMVLFPNKKEPAFPEKMVKQLTNKFIADGKADPDKIYIGGISMGGIGTYDMLIRYPGYFTAAFTICGACNVKLMTKKGKHQRLWIFHGAKDDVVSPEFDRSLYASLKKKNPDIKYTEYPEANHNSWDPAFAEPELLPWLFSYHK